LVYIILLLYKFYCFVGNQGQPALNISAQQIDFLLSLRLSVRKIARMLGVSQSTVRRRIHLFQIRPVRERYSQLSTAQVDTVVRNVVHAHPHAGIRMVRSYLMADDIRLTEQATRESLNRVNPTGIARRWSRNRCTQRRVYSVPHPNALWHIDGNMRLIRWRFVIHGGIDGHSRLISYLECSTDNKAETVLRHFTHAILSYGCPLRVRSDCGGENVEVAQLMTVLRGTNRGSHLAGKSTRNQRIERLWRDVFENCLSLYYNLFYMLESRNILDPDNDKHIIALKFVYQPRIQESLNAFKAAWNLHGLRTANYASPMQLWVSGVVPIHSNLQLHVDSTVESPTSNSPPPNEPEPENNVIEILKESLVPTSPSAIHGIELYVDALEIVLYHD